MNNKKAQLSAVLNAICNESNKRLYGLYWDKKYKSVIDFINDKSYDGLKTKEKDSYLGYFTTEHHISKQTSTLVFKKKFYDYVVFDSIFIDFDDDDNPTDAINQGIRVAKHLKHDLGLDVLLNYSGSKGCHIHILFNSIDLKHPEDVKKLFTEQIESNYKVTTDSKVKNSIKRLMRIPCTIHNNSGNYGHFIDFEDKEAIKTTLNNAEYSPSTIIENDAKYYIPEVPDRNKNTEIIKPLLEHLDNLAETQTKQTNENKYYNINIAIDTDDEFINKFNDLYYQGNRWNIGHAIIFMFKRAGWDDGSILEFFNKITPKNINNDAPNWLDWINGMDKQDKFAGMNYLKDKIKESIYQNPKLHGDDKEATANAYIEYFESIFKPDKSIYRVPKEMKEKGYKYDDNALYCPLENDYYLSISRTETTYLYNIVKYESNTFKKLTTDYSAKKPITTDDDKRLKALNLKINQNNRKNDTKIFVDDDASLEDKLSDIAIDLINVDDYKQITADIKEYKDIKKNESLKQKEEDIADNKPSAKAFNDYPAKVQKEAKRLIDNGTLFDNIAKTVKLTHANDSELIDTLILIDGTIYNGTPASSIVGGETGIGKTDVTESVALNYPDNHVFRLRTFSPKHIYYAKDEYNTDYNILIVDDVDLSKKANVEVLKELTDNKKPVKELKTVIDQKAVTYTLTGKFIVILTFAKTQEDAELLNRLFNTGIITDKAKATNVKHKIKSNTIIDADNNLLIKQLQEINKCAITKLVENDYKIFNPYTIFINPEYFNNRDVPAFINLVSANAFYNVANRHTITIGKDTVVLGTMEDIQKVISLWDIKAQKDKLSVRQQDILNLPIPEYTLEEAMKHHQKVINDYINSDSAGYKEALKREQWSRERIAKELEVSKNTIKFDLDTSKDDKNTKNLLELGLIDRYKFDEKSYNSMWVYYKPKNENNSKVLDSDLMYWYIGTNQKYQSKNPLNDKISIIINILYRYNFIINDKNMLYIENYCSNAPDIVNEDMMYKFLYKFFIDYNEDLVKVNDDTSAIDIMNSIDLMDKYLDANFEDNFNDDSDGDDSTDDDDNITIPHNVQKSSDFVPIPKSSEKSLNQNQRQISLVHSKSTNGTNSQIDKRSIFNNFSESDVEILLTLLNIVPDKPSLSLSEIKEKYQNHVQQNYNPEDPDEHLILKLDMCIDKFIKSEIIVKDDFSLYNNEYKFNDELLNAHTRYVFNPYREDFFLKVFNDDKFMNRIKNIDNSLFLITLFNANNRKTIMGFNDNDLFISTKEDNEYILKILDIKEDLSIRNLDTACAIYDLNKNDLLDLVNKEDVSPY